jgi:hypothetical protein
VEPTDKTQQVVVDDYDVPLGLAEVGDLFGIAEGTASKWHWRAKRGDFHFPKPDGYISRSTPYWWESTMLAWAREVGRQTAAERAAAARATAPAEVAAMTEAEFREPVAVG